MAFERQPSAAASLTLFCPLVFQRQGFQTQLDNTDWSPASDWPSEPIRNRTCRRRTEPWLDTTHIQQFNPSAGPLKGAARGQGQWPG